MSRLEISRSGLDLIESFEGFRAKAARLNGGKYTIGFGHTMTVRDGMVVNREQAEELLKWDIGPIQDFIRQNALTTLTQNQFDALISFAFNIGLDNFRNSDVLRHLNQGEPICAAIAMNAWRRSNINGQHIVVDALVRRRALETAMFLDTIGPRPAAPSPIILPQLDYSASLLAPKPDTIKNVVFEKSNPAPVLENEKPAEENIDIEEKIDEATGISQAQKDEIVGELLKDDDKSLGGEVLQFPNIVSDTPVIQDEKNTIKQIDTPIAKVEDLTKEDKAEPSVKTVAMVSPAPEAIVGDANLGNKNIFDPFTIFVIIVGLVAFSAGIYEAIGQGIFNNGLGNSFKEPSNIFIMLTIFIGAVTAIFGTFSLFFGGEDKQ